MLKKTCTYTKNQFKPQGSNCTILGVPIKLPPSHTNRVNIWYPLTLFLSSDKELCILFLSHLAKISLSKVFANVCHIYLGMSAPTKYMLHGRSLLNIRACFHTASCLVWIWEKTMSSISLLRASCKLSQLSQSQRYLAFIMSPPVVGLNV